MENGRCLPPLIFFETAAQAVQNALCRCFVQDDYVGQFGHQPSEHRVGGFAVQRFCCGWGQLKIVGKGPFGGVYGVFQLVEAVAEYGR